MIPKSKYLRREAIGRQVCKLRGPETSSVCRTCASIVGTKHAAKITERLRDLGASKETLAAVAPVCSRCVERIADLVIAIKEGRIA